MDITLMNWAAVALGAVAAFGLGMIWFSPRMFGKAWAAGSHDLQPPQKAPIAAMIVQLAGIVLLALVVGMTETNQAIMTAVGAILAGALIVAGMDLFSQKTVRATMIDAGYIVASGAVMILAQGIL